MITFRRMSLWQRLLLRIPSRRRAYEASLLAAITTLVRDPSLPCEIEGRVIPHGFGGDAMIDARQN
jgi:hypothetical protein